MLPRILLLIVISATVIGLLLYSQSRKEPLHVSGFIEADEIRVGSRLGGRVKEVAVTDGAVVEPGQILVRLEEFDLFEQQAQAEAELLARRAELKRLEAGFRDEEIGQAAARVERLKQKLKALEDGPRSEELGAARARQEFAQAQVDLARSTHERNLALIQRDKGAVTREALDRSTEELRAAQANKEVRDQELQLLERGTRQEDILAAKAELDEASQAWQLTRNGFRREDKEQAKAAVSAAQAAVDVLKSHREELEVKSPTAGVVEAIDLREGDLVAPNAPVLSIMDTSRMWVRAYVPENQLGLKLGQYLRVTVDSFPRESFEGELIFIARQAEFTPSNVQTPEERSKQVFRIKVLLRTGLDKLRPGMAADIWLEG
jgi:multidrug resistance efflux pump